MYFCKILKMVFRAIRCQAHRCSGAVWCASNEGGGSSKGVWTLFILVIMNYWGHTQGETANAKNQWGDVDKLGNRRAAVNTCAVSPSPQQGMLQHLPSLRIHCLPIWPHYGLCHKRLVQLPACQNTQAERAHSLRLACNTHAEEVGKVFKSILQRYNNGLKGQL